MPSHLIASSPARCRVVRPPGNLDRGQSFTIWLIVCFAAPQDGSCANEQDLQHTVPDQFWNGLSLPTDVEVSWNQEGEQWDRRPRTGALKYVCDHGIARQTKDSNPLGRSYNDNKRNAVNMITHVRKMLPASYRNCSRTSRFQFRIIWWIDMSLGS